ncbi:VOC family protein [Streptomyces albus subsp. chlorinus]|uniref:VOC family protein n=1 Tax=Streptomyces albus TaxID=1888 RepID=UPI00156FF984|nr:VOC family protein [Streptomyces albus]NSC20777.1 VOC family protein [Streptomyces albus subsp. chlorinus]
MAVQPGTACWVSLTTHDRQATEAFYGAVTGWSFEDGTLAPEARVATAAGQPVAGLNEAAAARELPARWTVFFLVEDADKAAELMAERGGTVAVGPVDFGSGRTVLGADPCGAAFGLWQGEAPPRWDVGAGEAPAELCLRTCDLPAALRFYSAVLGWPQDQERWPHGCLSVGARTGDPDPAVRPRWEVAFPVTGTAAAAARAERLGGTVLSSARESGAGGRTALRDPHGALFTLVERGEGAGR